MKSQYLIAAALIASGIGGMAALGAEQLNPLHPSYFVNKSQIKASHGDSGAIALPINPLQPNYYAWKAAGTSFMGARALHSDAYVDSRNPLYPGFGRN